MYALLALRLCNRGRLLSVRHCLVSLLCRCIVQRLSVTDFMHPCIPTLFDHLYASLHRAFGHTRPASVPGLNVGLPPSPRLGLRPKPHFQKLYRFIDSLSGGTIRRRLYYLSEISDMVMSELQLRAIILYKVVIENYSSFK